MSSEFPAAGIAIEAGTPSASRRALPWQALVACRELAGTHRRHLRLAVGPLAMLAFFLPWAHGPGILAGEAYSGFDLVGFAGRLQALDLTFAQGATLWLTRLVILALPVAGAWQTVLAPLHRGHPAYAASGWYIAGFAVLLVGLGLLRSGVVVPPTGLALMAAAGACWVGGTLRTSLRP